MSPISQPLIIRVMSMNSRIIWKLFQTPLQPCFLSQNTPLATDPILLRITSLLLFNSDGKASYSPESNVREYKLRISIVGDKSSMYSKFRHFNKWKTDPIFNLLLSAYLLSDGCQSATRAINHLCSWGPETMTLVTNTGKPPTLHFSHSFLSRKTDISTYCYGKIESCLGKRI